MKRQTLILLMAVLIVAAVAMISLWPRTILITPRSGHSIDGLYVVLLGNTTERFLVGSNGKTKIGRGVWGITGKRCPLLIAVADHQQMYWEGIVAPRLFEEIEIPLTSGRALTASETRSLFSSKEEAEQVVPPNGP